MHCFRIFNRSVANLLFGFKNIFKYGIQFLSDYIFPRPMFSCNMLLHNFEDVRNAPAMNMDQICVNIKFAQEVIVTKP